MKLIYNQLNKIESINGTELWDGLKFNAWTDDAKYEEENKKLSPRIGITFSWVPASGRINWILKCQKE